MSCAVKAGSKQKQQQQKKKSFLLVFVMVNVATAHQMIVCVSCTNYVFVKCNGIVLSGRAADICWFISMGVFFISRRGSLGLVQCPLLFLSANEESIFKVAMETIVFVVTAIGAAGRARFCYFCHESTPDTHACMPPCLCVCAPAHTRRYVFLGFFWGLHEYR